MAKPEWTRRTTAARRKPRTRQRVGGGSAYRNIRSQLKHSIHDKKEFDYDLLAMFVRNELAAQWSILLLALIFSLASLFWAPYEQAIGWLIIVVFAKVLLLDICRRFMAVPEREMDTKRWKRRLFIAEAVGGLTWAGFALVGVSGTENASPGNLFSSHVFLFASLMVVLGIRMTFAAPVPSILYIGTIPMTVAVVARLSMLGDFFYLALAAMAVGVHVYFVFLARGLRSTAQSMFEFRAQKDLLIAELEEAKSMSDLARRRAEDANLAKSQFLATMSHELRTPLNAILGFSEIMTNEIMGPFENPTYREYTANIHASGSHLLHLINEILDLSRIEAGKYELNEQAVNICDALKDCYQLMRLRAENKGLKVIQNFDPSLKTIWADERAIRQICLNLITNAIKFTPRGGSITLTTRAEADGGQTIIFTDTGPGISAEEIPKVLSAFGQGSLAQESAEGGTGLGLPIVSRLIELHGGKFELNSEVRRGTQAIVRIPATRVLQPMGRISDSAQYAAKTASRGRAGRPTPPRRETAMTAATSAWPNGARPKAASPGSAKQPSALCRPPRAFTPPREKYCPEATNTR